MEAGGSISGIFCGQAYGGIDGNMKLLIEEYGRILVTVLTGGIIIFILGNGFLTVWRENGGVNDSIKTNFQSNEVKRTPPVLTVKDFKIRQGETADFSRYVSAIDYDGKDITSEVQAIEDGRVETEPSEKKQNLLQTYGKTEWQTVGVLHFSLSVKSPVTGKTTRGKLIVLVDAPGKKKGGS